MKIATTPPLPALRFSRKDGSYQLRKQAFEDAYIGQVEMALTQKAGHTSLSGQGLQTAHRVAREMLGPIQALALGGVAMASLLGPQEAADLDEGMLERMKARPVGPVAGTPVKLYLGDQSGTGFGASTSRSVVLPEGFAALLPSPLGAFLVGHELGHVEHNDVVKRFGRQQVLASLEGSPWAQEARNLGERLEHETEFAADERGLDYAMAQGHSGEQIVTGFTKLLKYTEDEASSSHPGSQERLQRLQKRIAP